ncbi:hypothetical protein V1281_002852 [Nitrobacteraceae bacterium AZCC 2161]
MASRPSCTLCAASSRLSPAVPTNHRSRIGGSLIFLRGILRSGERSLFTFSGTIKRVKKRDRPAASAAE